MRPFLACHLLEWAGSSRAKAVLRCSTLWNVILATHCDWKVFLEQVVDGLVGVLADEVYHSLHCMSVLVPSTDGAFHEGMRLGGRKEAKGPGSAYLGHYGLPVGALDVPEGHLGALVVVELELREVVVGDLVQGNCEGERWSMYRKGELAMRSRR